MTHHPIPPETLAWFDGDELRARIFYEKYALRSDDGLALEGTPNQMWLRLASNLANVETSPELQATWTQRFLWLLSGFRMIPGGRVMAGVGNPRRVTSANCYVLQSPHDSIEGIFRTAHEMAETYKRGGGCGVDISTLRPAKSPVRNAALTSSGAVSFMPLYNMVTGTIGQCLAAGTRVLTDRGWRPIETLATGEGVWTDLGWKPITHVFPPRQRQVLHVRTKLGFEIDASPEHQFMAITPGGCELRKLSQLRVGDKIVLLRGTGTPLTHEPSLAPTPYTRNPYNNSNRLQTIRQPEVLTTNLAYFIGYYLANGSWHLTSGPTGTRGANLSVAIPLSRREIATRLTHILREAFGVSPRLKPGDGQVLKLCVSSRWLHAFFCHNDLMKPRSHSVRIPDIIRRAPNTILAAFLAGHFDADGYASGPKKGYVFATTSTAMARDLQLELLKLGIVTRQHVERRPRWRDLHSISVVGRSAQAQFVELTDPHSAKVQALRHISKRDTMLTPFTSRDLGIPYNNFAYLPSPPQFLSVAGLSRYLADTGDPQTSLSLHVQDEIVEITPRGSTTTHDIEVLDAHKFVAEGFYVSNSGRRGALMLTIADTHPDVLAFTRIKRDLTTVRFANISVRVSDALIAAVEADAQWPLHFENPEDDILINQVISARELWHELITGAWGFAEPGALFWDTVLRYSTSEYAGMGAASTNPCSEIPMGANDTCTLANINLAAFCTNPFTPKARLTIDLSLAIRYTVRFLDNLLTYNADHHAFPAQRETSLLGRRIGVGFTGLGDLLIQLGLRYDSDEAIAFTDRLFADIKETAYRMSVELAIEKGSFPAFDRDPHLNSRYFKEFPPDLIEAIASHGLRNVALLTVPPVGSGAAMAGVTSGIEPVFAFSYVRRSESLSKETFYVDHPLVQEYRRIHHLAADAPLPSAFITAHEIDALNRVMLQAAIQKHIDQGISSTINLAHDTTPETVDRIYRAAWAAGLKGVTVYREGSRQGILLTHDEAAKDLQGKIAISLTQAINRLAGTVLPTDTKLSEPPTEAELATLNLAIDQAATTGPTQLQLLETTPTLIPRPAILHGTTMAQPAPEGNLQITINEVNGDPFELIAHGGKAGSDILAWVQALARTASVLLRLQRLPSQTERLELLIEQWRDIAGSRSIGFGPNKVRSGPDGMAQALLRYLELRARPNESPLPTLSEPATPTHSQTTNGNCCPNCRSFSLITDEGCLKCQQCGFKEC